MATSTYGTPYVQGSDLVSAYPTASSNLATRVDEVSYKRNGLNAQTGTTYTLVAGDAGKTITLLNASAVAVTLPQDSTADLPDGAVVSFYNLGAGTVTISQGTGATLQGGSITLAQYAVTSVIKLSANTYGKYDGGGVSGLTLITTASPSAVTSVSIDNCFTATYRNYLIIISDVVGSVGAALRLRWRASSTDATGSNYKFANRYFPFSGGADASDYGNPTDHILIFGATGTSSQRSGAHLYANAPQIAAYTTHQVSGNSIDSAYAGAGMHELATSYDGFTLYHTSGTFTGEVKVYGLLN